MKTKDWKSCLYTSIWAIILFSLKNFIIEDIPLKIISYIGIVLIIIGFIYSIFEKKLDLPFFNAIPNWYGAGVIINACSLIGIGLALTFNTWFSFVLGSLIIIGILFLQRSYMTKQHPCL